MLEDEYRLSTPKPRPRRTQLSARERVVSGVLGLFAFGLGLALIIGGDDRFHGPAYRLARSWAPWWFWGSLFVLYGVALVLSRQWIMHHAVVFIGTFFYVLFCVSQIASILQQPTSPAPGTPAQASFVTPWVFMWFSIVHFFVAQRRFRHALEESDPLP